MSPNTETHLYQIYLFRTKSVMSLFPAEQLQPSFTMQRERERDRETERERERETERERDRERQRERQRETERDRETHLYQIYLFRTSQ